MADETTQRAVHKFFMERLQDLKPFSKKDLQQVTGWQDKALDTYWSKQYKGLVEDLGDGQFRMRERFRVLASWKRFQAFVTQVRTLPPTYAPTVYDEVVAYEFYLPLAHEAAQYPRGGVGMSKSVQAFAIATSDTQHRSATFWVGSARASA